MSDNEDYWDWLLDSKLWRENAVVPLAGNHEARISPIACRYGVENSIVGHFNVDKSLNQVIKRSIITSVTTIITVICLIVFGSHEIMEFNIALLVGLVAGTYSSLFIASQIWYMIASKMVGKPKKKKWYEIDEKEEKKIRGINS